MANLDQPQFDARDGEDEADDLSIDDSDPDDLDITDDDERDDEGQDIDLEPLAAHNRTSDNPESLTMAEHPRSFEPSKRTKSAASSDKKKKKTPPSESSIERRLDHGLKETFPASDPVSVNPGAD